MKKLINSVRDYVRSKLSIPWFIVTLSLVICVPVAIYGYSVWHDYHISNTALLQSVKPQPNTDNAQWMQWYDLKAQQEMAAWAYSLLWVGVVGLATSIAGIGFIFLNLRSLNDQNRIAQQIGDAQTRPYLSVATQAVVRETQRNYLGRKFSLSFSILNSGTTPAIDPRVTVVLYLDSEYAPQPDRTSPLFVRVLEDRPPFSSGEKQEVRITFHNKGIPEISDDPVFEQFNPDDPFSEQIHITLEDQIHRDGYMWLTLEVLIEFKSFAGSQQKAVGTEYQSGSVVFRKPVEELTLEATRSISSVSLQRSELYALNSVCPPTIVFGRS